MSITSALFAGATGVTAMSKSMQTIGNNIANINTVGFKGSRAEFADLLSQAINTPGGKKQIGRGTRVQSVQSLFHQGSFETTPVVTDVAINGAGFFKLVTDEQEVFYSRAGQFRINKAGDLT
ncbi:MAG: flagellar hook-basal body complex protein, partial [Candidatus Sumerlaeota bacterium]